MERKKKGEEVDAQSNRHRKSQSDIQPDLIYDFVFGYQKFDKITNEKSNA